MQKRLREGIHEIHQISNSNRSSLLERWEVFYRRSMYLLYTSTARNSCESMPGGASSIALHQNNPVWTLPFGRGKDSERYSRKHLPRAIIRERWIAMLWVSTINGISSASREAWIIETAPDTIHNVPKSINSRAVRYGGSKHYCLSIEGLEFFILPRPARLNYPNSRRYPFRVVVTQKVA